MKHLITILVLLQLPCYAQKKLEGLGEFKIGKTVVKDIPKITGVATVKLGNHEMMTYAGRLAAQVRTATEVYNAGKKDKKGLNILDESLLIGQYRRILVNHYSIADIKIEGISLLFKNDTLIQFFSEYSLDISKAMRINYGEPKADTSREWYYCTPKPHLRIEKRQKMKTHEEWENNGIMAEAETTLDYDEYCDFKTDSYFIVEDKNAVMQYYLLVADKNTSIEKRAEQEEIDKYKKF